MTSSSNSAACPPPGHTDRSLTPQEATVILAAREILGRYLNRNPVLSSWQAVLDYCAVSVVGPVERFHVLYLDRKNRLIADEQLATGTVDHVPVYPREVIKRALLLTAFAALSAGNLGTVLLPGELRHLLIACDRDPAGAAGAERLAARATAAGVAVRVLVPRLGDFNDDLRAFGREAMRQHLAEQLAPEDRQRLWG